ncbi:SMR family transporter [Tropicimonas sp. TH_r6]|uniref:DMT family transporter n=1 Tax=Tropicimonas sp. TH_r6 TaxID=3082085 RepID=UPI002953692D|nr:SMR family transporter [Tropicimonas sp. TH_r6]MDV7141735.1 SMR family transporter [Tropicimonas sp. TH_r6]
MPSHVLALIGAIIAEVIGTSALQASQQFTRPLPSLLVVLGYGAAFYLLAMALKVIPVGVAYAIWSGLGVVLISLLGLVVFGQKLDLPAIVGIGLILAGVVTIQLFSGSAHH